MIRVYISHTSGCTGWAMEDIISGTVFGLAHRTMDKPFRARGCKMLDWDYREFMKDPKRVKERHLKLAMENDYEVIMSMDLWRDNINESLKYADMLEKYCDRVLIPVHHFCDDLAGRELALPNANWFTTNPAVPDEFRAQITHLLGGSPQSHLEKILNSAVDLNGNKIRLGNIKSVDGNQAFRVAIKGKYWTPHRPFWLKPAYRLTNEQIFRISVSNMNIIFSRLG